MSSLVPQNTKNARAVGVNAFKRFLDTESVALDYVYACLANDASGRSFAAVMDRFAVYLAFHERASGKRLAKNTIMSYFRQVKNWLVDMYPGSRTLFEERVLKMGRILDKFCLKRESGGIVKKAHACAKQDLRLLMIHLYTHASSATDYQDAALLCLMWYLLGRASDLSLVQKQHVSVCSRNVFFLRLIRVKTAEEQGLTIYPDNDLPTFPILAIAAALVMQTIPTTKLLEHQWAAPESPTISSVETIPLADLLQQAAMPVLDDPRPLLANPSIVVDSTPGIHNHVNRLLDRISRPAGVLLPLSSHSFRRGGAQHANGDAQLSPQWIFDRGAWNLTSTNKAFAYVFNTTQEDQRVSRVLSGWGAGDSVVVEGLERLDARTAARVRQLQRSLFNVCTGLDNDQLNLCSRVLDVCTSRLLRAYPQLKSMRSSSPIIDHIHACADVAGVARDELLRWSVALEEACGTQQHHERKESKEEKSFSCHQAAVIRELIESNALLRRRLDAIENVQASTHSQTHESTRATTEEESEAPTTASKPRKNAPSTYLSSVWFDWFAGIPRGWLAQDRKKKSESKLIVSYMKLFLPRGLELHEDDADYRDHVLALGLKAEQDALAFLRSNDIRAKGGSSVLKRMRELHRRGLLNDRIRANQALVAAGLQHDPAPRDMQDIFHEIK